MQSEIQYFTYPSGLRLVYRHVPSAVTYIGVSVGSGTRDERPCEDGLAHYIEHGLFKGSRRFTACQLIDRIENVGGEMNAYTTKEDTTFYAAVPTAYTRRAAEMLADMLTAPLFPDEEMEKEKQVIYDEIESYNDSPSELIYDDYEALLYAGHPLANPVLGTKRTIRRFTSETAMRFVREHYRADNMVVFVESAKRFDDVRVMTGEVFGQLAFSRQPSGVSLRIAPSLPSEREAVWRKHTHQTHVMLGSRACHVTHHDRLTTALLTNILGGGAMNSRLNMELREKRGLVYTVEAVFQPFTDTGYWAVYFASEPEHAAECVELTMRELRRMTEQPLSQAALGRAIRQCIGQLLIADGNRENRALAMAKAVLTLGEAATCEQTVRRLRAIRAEDVQRVAKEIFNDIFILQYR